MHIGRGAVAFVVLMHPHFGVPLEKIVAVRRERFGVPFTASGSAQLLNRRHPRDADLHRALCAGARESGGQSDETGWRVGGVLHWLWVFATPDTTVYAIRPGRSFDDAATILDPAFDGVLIRDGWAPLSSVHGGVAPDVRDAPAPSGADAG